MDISAITSEMSSGKQYALSTTRKSATSSGNKCCNLNLAKVNLPPRKRLRVVSAFDVRTPTADPISTIDVQEGAIVRVAGVEIRYRGRARVPPGLEAFDTERTQVGKRRFDGQQRIANHERHVAISVFASGKQLVTRGATEPKGSLEVLLASFSDLLLSRLDI
jgi:hypothetical protein